MAWIKIDTALFHKPKVVRISSILGTKRAETVGLLVNFWSIVDSITEDGMLPGYGRNEIDILTDKRGFCKALEMVGWIDVSVEGVRICNFEKHNGRSAKRRAEGASRASKSYAKKVRSVTGETNNSNVKSEEYSRKKRGERREEKRILSGESIPRACAREDDAPPPIPSWAPLSKTVEDYAASKGIDVEETRRFILWNRERGWRRNGEPIVDWQASFELWMERAKGYSTSGKDGFSQKNGAPVIETTVDVEID